MHKNLSTKQHFKKTLYTEIIGANVSSVAKRIIIFTLGVLFALAGVVLFYLIQSSVAILMAIQALGSLAVAASALVAYSLYRSTVDQHRVENNINKSRVFLEESKQLLNRAYETFTQFGKNPPKNDRFLWLTTARMIVRYRNMRNRITVAEHIDIVDEHEEYCRLQFYQLLQQNKEEFTENYFIPSGDQYGGDVVARNAVAVIFDYAKWKEDMPDPLDHINDKELFARGVVPIDFHGVRSFLERYSNYWDEIQKLKR